MHRRDTYDVITSLMSIVGDACAIYAGMMFAVWIRFFSGWVPFSDPLPPMELYWQGAGIATLLFIFIFGSLGLYKRPQLGTFGDKLPRLLRAVLWSIGLAMILAFALRTDPPFSRLATAISFFTVMGFLTLERMILFRLEIWMARHRPVRNHITIVGTGENAAYLRDALQRDPRLRSVVTAFIVLDDQPPAPGIPPEMIRGTLADLGAHIEAGKTNQVILSQMTLSHTDMVDVIVLCERAMINFNLVPDLFGILTSKVNIQNIDGMPLLGMGKWPLDYLGNRLLKRAEDVAGALIGLILSAPVIAILAVCIKKTSPGPVFYRQERCGESGRPFTLYKLRTMPVNAEAESGPVWATPDDPRRTRIGAFMRRHNLDELPQFWNVLKGDMSLVGPRPERPHFVERFKEDIGSYMWRQIYKPGMTGWAQINGLRGHTGLEERIKHDLYYLENWSLSFDFKILIKTLMARENAY